MPTYTAITLDWLLEPRSRNPALKPSPMPARVERPPAPEALGNKKIPWPYASPVLYRTPEAAPLPDSPSSFLPSPYIINHKRRGPHLLKSLSQSDINVCQMPSDVGHKDEIVSRGQGGEAVNGIHNGNHEQDRKIGEEHGSQIEGTINGLPDKKLEGANLAGGFSGHNESTKSVAADPERYGESDDFFDLQDSISMSSNTEVDDSNGLERLWKPTTPPGEYFDAFEEISSEGAAQSTHQDIEQELHEIRLNVLMEIERRKQAEEALENLQNQWQRLSHQLSHVGLELPVASTISEEKEQSSMGPGQSSMGPGEDLCQQVVLARLVAGAVGRACSRAEVELEMEPLIESKNFKIARLWDRLHYYEAANREMSQRNQEAIEMVRQQRQRRKRQQKWFWSSIGVAVTLGAAAIAWSYFRVPKPSSDDTATCHEQ